MSQPLMTVPSCLTDMFPVSCRSSSIRGPVVLASGNPQVPGEVQAGVVGGGSLADGEAVGEGEPEVVGEAEAEGGGGSVAEGVTGSVAPGAAACSLTAVRSAW